MDVYQQQRKNILWTAVTGSNKNTAC